MADRRDVEDDGKTSELGRGRDEREVKDGGEKEPGRK